MKSRRVSRPKYKGKRTWLSPETLEQRYLLDAGGLCDITFDDAQTDAIRNGTEQLSAFFDNVESLDVFAQRLNLFYQQDSQPFSLGSQLDLGDTFRSAIVDPTASYLSAASSPTSLGLANQLRSQSLVDSAVGGETSNGPSSLLFDVEFGDSVTINDFRLGLNTIGEVLGVELDQEVSGDLTISLGVELTYGVTLDSDGLIDGSRDLQDIFFIDDLRVTLGVDATLSGAFAAQVGFLDVMANVDTQDFTADMDVILSVDEAFQDENGRTRLSDLTAGFEALSLVDVETVVNEVNGELAFDVAVGQWEFDGTPEIMIQGDLVGEEITATSNADYDLATTPFRNINASVVALGADAVGGWFNGLVGAGVLNTAVPFSTARMGDLLPVSSGYSALSAELRDADGLPTFDSAQTFSLGDSTLSGYDPATQTLLYDVSLDLGASEIELPISLGQAVGPINGLAASNTQTLSSAATATFTLGVDLSELVEAEFGVAGEKSTDSHAPSEAITVSNFRFTGSVLQDASGISGEALYGILGLDIGDISVQGGPTILIESTETKSVRELIAGLLDPEEILETTISGSTDITLQEISIGDSLFALPSNASIVLSKNDLTSNQVQFLPQNVGPLSQFSDLSFDHILNDLLPAVEDFTRSFQDASANSLSIVRTDPSDIIDTRLDGFSNELQNRIDDYSEEASGLLSLQRLAPLLEQEFEFAAGNNVDIALMTSFDASGNDLRLDLDVTFEGGNAVPFGLNISQWIDNTSSDGLVAGGEISTDGLIVWNANVTLSLDSGFNLSNPIQPIPYLYDSTQLSASFEGAAGLDAEVSSLGVLGLALDGVLSLTNVDADTPTLMVTLPPSATGGRYQINQLGGLNLNADPIQTALDVNLTMSLMPLEEIQTTLVVDDGVVVEVPDFEEMFDAVQGLELNLSALAQGVDGLLTGLENALSGEIFGLQIPVIGEALEKPANAVREFHEAIQSTLDDVASEGADVIADALEASLVSVFDGLVNVDVVIDEPSQEVLLTFSRPEGQPGLASTFDANTTLGLPALGIDIDASFVSSFEHDFAFTIGVNPNDGVYLSTNLPEEFSVDGSILGFGGLEGRLGFLTVSGEILNPLSPLFDGHIGIDLRDPNNDGKLTLAELAEPGFQFVHLDVEAAADLQVELRAEALAFMPELVTTLDVSWNSSAGVPPSVSLSDLHIPLDGLLDNFLGSFINTVDDIVAPMIPVAEALTAPLPIVSDLLLDAGITSETTSLLTLAELAFPSIDTGFIEAISAVAGIVTEVGAVLDVIEGDPGENIRLSFGDINFGNTDLRDEDALADGLDRLITAGNPLGTLAASAASGLADTLGLTPDGGDKSNGFRANGFSIPILEDPTSIFGLLLGLTDDVGLITWDIPELSFFVPIDISFAFPPFPALQMGFFGGVGVAADLSIGYDTVGLVKFKDSKDPADLFDGFYVGDTDGEGNDVPELEVTGEALFQASLGIPNLVSAGVAGGVVTTLAADLVDDDGDGKIRGRDFFDGGCIMSLQGSMDVKLEVFVRLLTARRDFPFGEFNVATFDLTPNCPFIAGSVEDEKPILASRSGETLTLLVGDLANERSIEPDAIDENYSVVRQGDKIVVSAFGKQQTFNPAFVEITRIVARAGAGNDSIFVDDSVDFVVVLEGGADDDVLRGGTGTNILRGGAGNDILIGNLAVDDIDGGANDDIISGFDGQDVIEGGLGDDEIDGGDGDDTITDTGGENIVHGGLGSDTITTGDENDTIYAGDGRNEIRSGGGNDIVFGGSEIDIVFAGPGMDEVYGGDADDEIHGEGGDDILSGEGGEDTIHGGGENDLIIGGDGIDILQGEGGDDVIHGLDGDDVIHGGDGRDEIYGGLHNDTISGGPDDDTIFGEEGEDVLNGEAGDDFIDGGSDDDTINGGADADTLFGRTGQDTIRGNAGDDFIDGGEDDDSLFGEADEDEIDGGPGNDTIQGNRHDDILRGGTGDDIISGGFQHDRILGGPGEDTIYGDAGHDIIDGGSDNDRIFGGTEHDNITGAEGDDYIEGNAGDDTLRGGGGDDIIEGHDGDDFIDGGSENDLIYGGNDQDEIYGGAGDDIIRGGDADDILGGGPGNDLLIGSNGSDIIRGDAGIDILHGMLGGDTLDGGDGDDRIHGNEGDDILSGGTGSDLLEGHDGNDVLSGDAGDDRLFGGLGKDSLSGGSGEDYLDAVAGLGNTLRGGPDNDTLIGSGDGASTFNPNTATGDFLFGDDGDDDIRGLGGADLIEGGPGRDTIDGGTHQDQIDGGPGLDTIVSGGDIVVPGDTVSTLGTSPPKLGDGPTDDSGRWIQLSGSASQNGISNIGGVEQTVQRHSNGDTYVAWVDSHSGNNEIFVARHSNGEWQEINGSASNGGVSQSSTNSRRPALLVTDTDVIVAWVEFDVDGQSSQLRFASMANDWGPLEETLPVNATSNSTKVLLAPQFDGLAAAWLKTVNGVPQVFSARYLPQPAGNFEWQNITNVTGDTAVRVDDFDFAGHGNDRVVATSHGVLGNRSVGIAHSVGASAWTGTREFSVQGDNHSPAVSLRPNADNPNGEGSYDYYVAWQEDTGRTNQVRSFVERNNTTNSEESGVFEMHPHYASEAAPRLAAESISDTLGFAGSPVLSKGDAPVWLAWIDDDVRGGETESRIFAMVSTVTDIFHERNATDASGNGITSTGGAMRNISIDQLAGEPAIAWNETTTGTPQVFLRLEPVERFDLGTIVGVPGHPIELGLRFPTDSRDPDRLRIVNATIEWGDGTPNSFVSDVLSQTLTHTYNELRDYEATVTMTNVAGETVVGTATIEMVSLLIEPDRSPINEGEQITLSGRLFDELPAVPNELQIRWGNTPAPQNIQLANGQSTFQITHDYLDDAGTSTDFAINATITGLGTSTARHDTQLQVLNVTPEFDAGLDVQSDSSLQFQRTIDFQDPGTEDTHTVTVDWGDETTSSFVVPSQARQFDIEHNFASAGFYTVTVTVEDELSQGTDRFVVEIESTEPTIPQFSSKVIASDRAARESFGQAIAIDENFLVVGAPRERDQTGENGAAYVFERSGDQWTEVAKLAAPNGRSQDQFGISVAISGDTIFVGAPNYDEQSLDQGAVFVYHKSGADWPHAQTIYGSQSASRDRFGFAIDAARDTNGETVLVVGSPDHASLTGEAYVFRSDGSSWSEEARLSASDSTIGDHFGISVATDGDQIIIGADRNEIARNFRQGAAYVYRTDQGTWSQQAMLTSDDGSPFDRFGAAVAIDGGTAVVSAPDHKMAANRGAVYTFSRAGSAWNDSEKIHPPASQPYVSFGASLTLQQDTLTIGGFRLNDAFKGVAYIADRVSGVWELGPEITPDEDDAEQFDRFGSSIAIADGQLLIGTPGDRDDETPGALGTQSGSVYVYQVGATQPPPRIPGDIGVPDGRVDFGDFLILASNFGRTNASLAEGDVDGDGTISFGDFLILASNFGRQLTL